jgi:hypothetical protein
MVLVVMFVLGFSGVAQADPPPGRGKLGETLNFEQALTGQFQTQGDQDNDDGDEVDDDEGLKPHPVLLSLARHFAAGEDSASIQTTYDAMQALHAQGYGVGNIAKAYFLAARLGDEGLKPADILAQTNATGWGTYLKSQGVHPGSVAGVGAVRGAKNGTFVPPGQAKKLDGTFLPPGQAKKLDETALPPGQAKKQNGTFIPPGQAKKQNGQDKGTQ